VAERKRALDEIQRRAAAQVYYLYAPFPKGIAAWTPRVKAYWPTSAADRGAQLEAVWLEET
jgi:hypothetical protein